MEEYTCPVAFLLPVMVFSQHNSNDKFWSLSIKKISSINKTYGTCCHGYIQCLSYKKTRISLQHSLHHSNVFFSSNNGVFVTWHINTTFICMFKFLSNHNRHIQQENWSLVCFLSILQLLGVVKVNRPMEFLLPMATHCWHRVHVGCHRRHPDPTCRQIQNS